MNGATEVFLFFWAAGSVGWSTVVGVPAALWRPVITSGGASVGFTLL